jgi:O-antigen/teichoic acid export membrane protein
VVAGFALFEPDPARRCWLFVTALTLPALAPAVIGSAFRIRQDQLPLAVISTVSILAMLAVTVVGLDRGAAGTTFAAIYVLREVVNGAGIWIVGRARHGLVLTPGLAGRDAVAFIRSAIPQNVAVVFQVLSLNFGLFALRAFLGETELGAYSAAWRLVNPVLLLVGALVAPLMPVLARVARRPAAFGEILSPAVGLGAGIGVLGASFLLAAGRDALRVLYDRPEAVKFSAGALDAGPVLVWLGFVFAVVSVGAVATTALLCADGERQLRAIAIGALIVNVLTFAVLAPPLGRVAAAAGLLAAEIWTAAAALAVLGRTTGRIHPPQLARSVAPALGFAAAMVLVPSGLAPATRVVAAAALAGAGLVAIVGFGPGRRLRRSLAEIRS